MRQARLNTTCWMLSPGTRVDILTDPSAYDHPNFHGYDTVRLSSPPTEELLKVAPQLSSVFSIECDYLTLCRTMVDEIPQENRHKRRAKKRDEYGRA